jgi:hypothetical protein
MSGGGGGGGGLNTPDSNESRNFTHVVHSTWCPPPRAAPDVGGRGEGRVGGTSSTKNSRLYNTTYS